MRTKFVNLNIPQIVFILSVIITFYISYYIFVIMIDKKNERKNKIFLNSKYIDYFILVLLISNILFFLQTGSGLAGSTKKIPFSFLRQIFPLNNFIYIYYTLKRKDNNNYFKIIIVSFLIFNFARGWTGHLLFLFLLELYFRSNGSLSLSKVIKLSIFSFLVPIIYSISYTIKMYIRINDLIHLNYLNALNHLVGRLSSISNVCYIYEVRNTLSNMIEVNLGYFSYIKESISAIVPNFLLPFGSHDTINHFLTLIAYPEREGISFLTGIIGKFIAVFNFSVLDGILSIIYMVCLLIFAHFIAVYFYKIQYVNFLVFITGVNFILNSNISLFTLFIYSLLMFLLVIKIINLFCQFNKKIKRRRF